MIIKIGFIKQLHCFVIHFYKEKDFIRNIGVLLLFINKDNRKNKKKTGNINYNLSCIPDESLVE